MTGAPAPPRPPLPAGWRLRPDPGARRLGAGTTLLGGSPLRVLTLTPEGARAVAQWWSGAPVGPGEAERRLARRLLDAGLAHPDPPPGSSPADLTVVIPVRDRPGELRRCLAAIDPRCRVVVVDDASVDGDAVAAAARAHGAACVRLDACGGPSAARNAGLRAARTPFVAFVDSDCVVPPGFPGRLLDHLGDPALAVAAPRIAALDPDPPGLLARYEAHHSALDMGPREGFVRPGSAIPYAPSAALVARAAALGPGFDEELSMGEDVDLLWRIGDAGWQVRYDPSVAVRHDHRTALRPWFLRRIAYNESNAVLLRRHPGRIPALSLSRVGAAFWAAMALRVPLAAAGVSAVAATTLSHALRGRIPRAGLAAVPLVVMGHVHEGRHLGRALTGPWLPFLAGATALRPSLGRRLWLGVAAGVVWEWAAERHEPTPLHYALPKAAEDLARCIGVWRGCWRERTAAPLRLDVRRR